MNLRARLPCPLFLFVCLVWLGLPHVSLAAGDAPRRARLSLARSGPLGERGPSAAAGLTGAAEHARAPRGLRLLTEVGTGLLTSVGGGVSLGLLGFGLCQATRLGYETSVGGCLGPASVGTVLGAVAGYPLGVWWGGELQGGDGGLLSTGIGASVGLLAGLAVTVLVAESGTPSLAVPLIAVPALFVTGAHLGYELSQRAPPPVLPVLSFSSRGAQLGLGGRF